MGHSTMQQQQICVQEILLELEEPWQSGIVREAKNCGIMNKELDCGLRVSKFELSSVYHI